MLLVLSGRLAAVGGADRIRAEAEAPDDDSGPTRRVVRAFRWCQGQKPRVGGDRRDLGAAELDGRPVRPQL